MVLVPMGMNVTGTYEIRSGFCSDCGQAFLGEPRADGLRYCSPCAGFRQGELKGSGTLDPRPPEENDHGRTL